MSILPAVALIGCDAPVEIKSSLANIVSVVCQLPHDKRLQTPVRSHADMLLRVIGSAVFCSKEYYKKNLELFSLLSNMGYTVTASDAKISAKYPNDIAFNVISVKNTLIGRLNACAEEILEHSRQSGMSAVSVKQGYAACSTLLLGDSALISSDAGIINAASSIGLAALKIQSSPAIRLSGYERGFIGGACGVYKNKVYFAGRYEDHPDAKLIESFCARNGYEAVSLCDIPLTDVGGIIFIPSLI